MTKTTYVECGIGSRLVPKGCWLEISEMPHGGRLRELEFVCLILFLGIVQADVADSIYFNLFFKDGNISTSDVMKSFPQKNTGMNSTVSRLGFIELRIP